VLQDKFSKSNQFDGPFQLDLHFEDWTFRNIPVILL